MPCNKDVIFFPSRSRWQLKRSLFQPEYQIDSMELGFAERKSFSKLIPCTNIFINDVYVCTNKQKAQKTLIFALNRLFYIQII